MGRFPAQDADGTCAKFDAATFILAGEIHNHNRTNTEKIQTKNKQTKQ